jgi:hypothetical protein
MGKAGKDGKPRGRMSAYAYFVQTCREEHKKKHPGESVVFAEFSRKCAGKWKGMGPKEKKRFDEMAEKDKSRYQKEMADYVPPAGEKKGKRKKDPNAPKRAWSAFFFFCGEERAGVRAIHPTFGVGDVAKSLGKMWEVCPNKPKFEAMAAKDKKRYEAEMVIYKKTGVAPPPKPKVVAPPPPPAPAEDDDDDDDDEEDGSDEEDDDDDEDDE